MPNWEEIAEITDIRSQGDPNGVFLVKWDGELMLVVATQGGHDCTGINVLDVFRSPELKKALDNAPSMSVTYG